MLVVDQTMGDASIAGGLASLATFARMLAAARAENPDAEMLVKTHPEVTSGRKKGYLSKVSGPGIRLFYEPSIPGACSRPSTGSTWSPASSASRR